MEKGIQNTKNDMFFNNLKGKMYPFHHYRYSWYLSINVPVNSNSIAVPPAQSERVEMQYIIAESSRQGVGTVHASSNFAASPTMSHR